MDQEKASSLVNFKLEGVEFLSEDLDDGCFYYTKACQVNLRGLTCTAKQVDRSLIDLHLNAVATENGFSDDDLLLRYTDHCLLLSRLRHPHIIQFFGLFYTNESPSTVAIVSERQPASLDNILERYGGLQEEISYSILRDVALGLSYLHSLDPSVVHGELCACNVLLSWDMSAKISDIGIGEILKLTPEQRRKVGRDTLAHLPPETLSNQGDKSGRLSTKVDCYAYGALIVHTLSANYPEYLALRASRVYSSKDSDKNGIDDILGGVSPDHPLASLALQCLNRLSELRPRSSQIVTTVTEMMLQFPTPSFERRVEILQRVVKTSQSRKLSSSFERAHSAIERKDSIVSLSNTIEIEHLKLQIEELQVENRGLRTSIKRQQSIINARDQEMAAKLMAKDQEIISNQEEVAALEAAVSTYKATISAKDATVHGLMNQLRNLQEYIANKHEPHLLSPQAQLKWRHAAHLPQAMVFAQAVCVGELVYFGSGTTTMSEGDGQRYKIFLYDLSRDKWKPVDHCPVVGFGMSNFMDQLTLVGGAYESAGEGKVPYALTGDVHTYSDRTGEFEPSIPSMPTPRLLPTVLTYGSTMIACGGVILDEKHDICVSTVEVYSSENTQWYRAEPLPLACTGMSYATIHEHSYLLGGFTDTDFDHPTMSVFSVSLQRLVEDALTRSRGFGSGGAAVLDSPTLKIWQRFPDAPRYAATATSIGGCLVAIGGSDESLEHKSGALHVFSPLTNSWSRMDDIPVMCFSCAVTRLPRSELLIIGGMGHDEEDALKTVFRGRVHLD